MTSRAKIGPVTPTENLDKARAGLARHGFCVMPNLERELTESALVEWTALQARVHGYRHRQGPSKASPTKSRPGSDRLQGVARSDSVVVYVISVVGRLIFPPRFLD